MSGPSPRLGTLRGRYRYSRASNKTAKWRRKMTVIVPVYSYSNSDPAPKQNVSYLPHFILWLPMLYLHSKVCNGQVTYRVPTYIMLRICWYTCCLSKLLRHEQDLPKSFFKTFWVPVLYDAGLRSSISGNIWPDPDPTIQKVPEFT